MNRENINIADFRILGSTRDKLLFLLKFASIAPSSHNTQPWKFKADDNTIEISPDFKRKLGYSDPVNRELFLSLGTCVANLTLASKSYGLEFEIEKINPGTVRLKYNNLEFKLADERTLNAIIDRSCNREPFEARDIPPEFVEKMKLIAKDRVEILFATDTSQKTQIINEVGAAIQDAFLDKGFTKELSGWIKPSLQRFQVGMPGYYIGVPLPVSFVLPWIIGHLKIDKMQRKMDEAPLKTAPMLVVLCKEPDEISSWIEAGQVFEEIAIEATKFGLKIGVQGAPIEIGSHYAEIKRLFGAAGRPMMFFRIGFTAKTRPKSPRLRVSQLVS